MEIGSWKEHTAAACDEKAEAVEEALVHMDNVLEFVGERAAQAVRECAALLRVERSELRDHASTLRANVREPVA